MKWFDKLNETYFNLGYILIAIVVGVLAIVFGFATAEVLLGIMLKAVTYTISSVVFMKALMGPEVDVKKEILKNKNTPLAILVAGFLCGLGFSIGGM
jgi:ABC-type multidrug transport system permease subunit